MSNVHMLVPEPLKRRKRMMPLFSWPLLEAAGLSEILLDSQSDGERNWSECYWNNLQWRVFSFRKKNGTTQEQDYFKLEIV